MNAVSARTRWARRVDPVKVRRLYQGDAQGMLDVALLDDVGYGIYARCQAMLEVAAAWRGQVTCWGCGTVVPRRQGRAVVYAGHGPIRVGGKAEALHCDACGWQTTWGAYRRSVAGKHLDATGIEPLLRRFVERWPAERSPPARLALIDALIHEFHCWDGSTVGSPIGATLIRATAEEALALFDDLAYGPGSTPGLQRTRQRWAARLQSKRAQRPMGDLRAIARELGIRGRSRMRRAELEAAIARVAPERLEGQ